MQAEFKVDIFIRSYEKDFEWLYYCLQSIRKFCKGFNSVVIVVPHSDKDKLNFCQDELVHGTCDNCEGYLAQQVTKLYADNFCKADYVLHVDSDCIFTKETRPEDFFKNDKPVILYEDNVQSPWQEIARITLGWFDSREYMRRMPIIYPTWIYPEFRKWIKENQKHELETWICSQPYRQFSEFNTVGQWANKLHNEKFTWLLPSEMDMFATQHWSWGGIESVKQQIQEILK
jgi:hypothetical protein